MEITVYKEAFVFHTVISAIYLASFVWLTVYGKISEVHTVKYTLNVGILTVQS